MLHLFFLKKKKKCHKRKSEKLRLSRGLSLLCFLTAEEEDGEERGRGYIKDGDVLYNTQVPQIGKSVNFFLATEQLTRFNILEGTETYDSECLWHFRVVKGALRSLGNEMITGEKDLLCFHD